MRVGCIHRHDAFYADRETGEQLGKYLVVLASPPGDDLMLRVLTSLHAGKRPHGCYHGVPYPGFGLGVPGGELTRPAWVDLREQNGYGRDVFQGRIEKGVIRPVLQLDAALLRRVLECATGADDTTPRQERHMRDALANLAP